MLRLLVFCMAVFLTPQALAQTPPSVPASNPLVEKPVSLSFTHLIQCFPELKKDLLSFKVDLNQLKEEADRKFVTSQSLLRYRQVLLRDSSGVQKRLRLAAGKADRKGQVSYTMTVDQLDSKGAGTPIALSKVQSLNPSQKVLDQYFLNQEVLEDELSYFDTKLNSVSMSYKRNFKDLFELEISDPRGRRRLFCEEKKKSAVICTCSQK